MKRYLLAAAFIVLCAALVAGQGKTLKVFWYSPELTDQYNDMAKAYQAETGNTLDITVNQPDYRTLMSAKINSGDIPDVFMSSAYSDNVTYKDYVYDLTDADFMKQLEPSALAGVTVNGRITGYPFLVQSHSFIYNKKIFADAGIKTLPRTLGEYEAVAKKLQARGIQPFATGYKEWWVLPQTAWQVLAPAAGAYGGFAGMVDKLNSGALTFKNIKGMSTVFDVLDLIKKYGGPKPMESDFNDQCSLLATGKAAIIHQGNWAEDTIRKTTPDIDIGYLRGAVAGTANEAGIMYDSNQTIRVYKDGQVELALSWLKWLTTSEYGKAWVPDKIKQMSPIKGSKSPAAQLAQATAAMLAAKVPSYPWFYQMFPAGTEQGLGIIIQGYCAGQTNRQQALDALDAAYTKIVNASK
ncbi:MAG: extracellular solute-binding protein [Spirochaetia bacterium]|jgi:raffinose/stachyose/melibiose transport system substrate-binding protein